MQSMLKTIAFFTLVLLWYGCNSKDNLAGAADKTAIKATIDSLLGIQEKAYHENTEAARMRFAATCDDSLFFVGGDDGGFAASAEFYTHDFADGYVKWPSEKQYRILENTAIVTFKCQTFKAFNRDTIFFNTRGTKVFAKEGKNWKMVYVTYAPLPVRYQPVKQIDNAILSDYTGLYQSHSDKPDTISLEGNKLYFSAAGAERSELLPINDSTFIENGWFGKTVFSRDAFHSVKYYYFEFPDGQRLVFPKIAR